jgi:Kef-type K+ transport system membrane component KefB
MIKVSTLLLLQFLILIALIAPVLGGGEGGNELTVHVYYEDIYNILVFLFAVYVAGLITKNLGMPALVGEIITGFLLGPPLADFVPEKKALVLVGEIGLIFLIIEAGIELDLQQLRQTGTRAMAIAFIGSILPICSGVAVIMLGDKEATFKSALAVGFSFAPTSLGVASSALSSGDASDTPVGQLIMAACVLTDIIGLVLLSMFQVLVKEDPKLIEYFIPILSSFGFLVLCGLAAIYFLSGWIEKLFLQMLPKQHQDTGMFVGAFAMCLGYLPMMYYTKASYLAGAFLVGFTFSLVKGAHQKFVSSTHSMMEWLLKIFFATTIGFQVPVKLLFGGQVLLYGVIFWCACILIKVLVVIFVPRFGSINSTYDPYKRDLLTTGFSMTCRGELNFIIAAFALDKEVIDPQMYASIVFAVLLSAITSPFMLLQSLNYFNALHKKHLKASNPALTKDSKMPLHFHIDLETKNAWSLTDRLQTCVSKMGFEIEDYRTGGRSRDNSNPIIYSNIYVRDTQIKVEVSTIKNQKEILRLEQFVSNRSPGYEYLWDTENDSKPLTGEQMKEVQLITAFAQDQKVRVARMKDIEKTLHESLKDLEIVSLTVSTWEPWSWNIILDQLSLKRPNGSEVSFEFLMSIFEIADVDESGTLDADELCEALQKAGINLSREGLDALITVVDENTDGVISLEEWENAIRLYLEMNERQNIAIANSDTFEEIGNV